MARAPKRDGGTKTPSDDEQEEGLFIGPQLKQIELEAGVSRRQLSKDLGVSYSHLTNLTHNIRRAGLPTIAKLSKATGRPYAFFFGDLVSLSEVGTLSALGRITMHPEAPLPGLIRVSAAAGDFAAGDLLHVYPSAFRPEAWLVVDVVGDPEPQIVWATEADGQRYIERVNTEVVRFDERIHHVRGCVQLITHAPRPPHR